MNRVSLSPIRKFSAQMQDL